MVATKRTKYEEVRNMARALCASVVCALLSLTGAMAAVTDLATAPLETSAAALVKPNIFFVLDDSGSMDWNFMPDWVDDFSLNTNYVTLFRNGKFNSLYYDPSTTYTPPLKYDGSSYNSMTSANTSAWTSVPNDGFGVQDTGSTDLSGSAYYYLFIPGEFCTTANQTSCNTQQTATATYSFPAYVRWCSTTGLSTCQAVRDDVGTTTFKNPRTPGNNASTATITLVSKSTSSTLTNVSGITVNGNQIMATGTAITQTGQTAGLYLAAAIVNSINRCASVSAGNCAIAGYSASYDWTTSGTTTTITISIRSATSALGATSNSYKPVVTANSTASTAVSTSAANFDGGTTVIVPGADIKLWINAYTSSYVYPGTAAVASTRTDCASTSGCTYAEEMTNYANWWSYYHTRMQMMKSSASIAFNVLTTSYRLGYMSINNNTSSDFLNISDITTGSTGQKSKWYAKLLAANPNNSTPLRTALATAGRLYAGKLNGTTFNGSTVTDPMQYSCQKNFTILSTDGYWNEISTPKKIDGSTSIGDQDSGEARPYKDGNSDSNTLADVAEYYYATDLRTTALGNNLGVLGTDVASNGTGGNSPQRMYTYTLGLGASGLMLFQPNYATAVSGDYFSMANGSTASSTVCTWQSSGSTCTWPSPVSNTQTTIDDLWHAGVNGRGVYRSAANSSDVKSALTAMLNNIDAQTSNSAAATTSGSNLSVSGNYEFSTNFRSVDWFGELLSYQIDPVTGAIASSSSWSAQSQLDSKTYSTRNIYTYDPIAGSRVNFDWSSLSSTQQAYFQIANIGSLSQLCTSGSSCLPSAAQVDSSTAGTTTGAGGINLVNYLRGDRSNEGIDNTAYYRPRSHVLGDIVNSQPAYVKKPEFSYTDTGYADYVTAKATRQGMVYVGANDGMLHAFNADTGAEVWSYIPSMLLPNLYKLADKNYSANHRYFVDGSPHTGDVYFDSAWHTLLVGGMGSGGRGLFALDITDPSTPTVLWEFRNSASPTTGYVIDADLGYTFGTPAFTKLTDGTWVVLIPSGYNNVSDGTTGSAGSGKGLLYVVNAKTGAIIKKIDSGVGSATATVTGCAAIPCPSGLAQMRTWVDHAQVNNTAPRVYAGDLFGNVWRFDISNVTSTGGTATVQLLATLADASGNRQPVTSRPELGLVNSQAVVFVGTGEFLGVSDVASTAVQSLYAIKDPLTTSTASGGFYGSPRAGACGTTTTSCFVRQTLTDTSGVRTATTNSVNFTTQNGWFTDLPESGERISTDANLQLGTLVVTSNIPGTSGNVCATAGSSYTNYFNYATGSAVTGATNVGVSNSSLASSPTLVRTTSGAVKAIINLSDATQTTANVPISASSRPTRRISWRELIDGR